MLWVFPAAGIRGATNWVDPNRTWFSLSSEARSLRPEARHRQGPAPSEGRGEDPSCLCHLLVPTAVWCSLSGGPVARCCFSPQMAIFPPCVSSQGHYLCACLSLLSRTPVVLDWDPPPVRPHPDLTICAKTLVPNKVKCIGTCLHQDFNTSHFGGGWGTIELRTIGKVDSHLRALLSPLTLT